MDGPLTFGSLFAGIGGFDLGFERAGMVCKWQVEIDDYANRVLEKHWPDVRRHRDIKTFPPGEADDWRVDVICGGFPCKQTSVGAAIHGRRSGLAGTDSGLWFEMLRVVHRLQPRFVVVENTGGASKWSTTITGGLANVEYVVSQHPEALSASDVGAPHQRRRLFWIAHRDQSRPPFSWATRSSAVTGEPGRTADRDDWLSAFPATMRVDDGVPGTLDRRQRITALGNAVVPQVAEWIGRRIVEAFSG